ncbi:hypothetical protein GOBAR_DD16423 [Gossypium barbadense]|nr:hypothetical protein GOBAR_DD16423 [Gossypium barbadense]
MSFDEEESFEHTLLVVREVTVYKIPPRSTSGGYKCGEWLQSDKIWSGRLRVVSCKDRCEIRLEDPNSAELFAACFIYPGQRESSVEPALDSSRYFVLKIEDGNGKHAFIGLGFNERNEAFDFNVALSDHDKYVSRENEKEASEKNATDSLIDIHPAVNHRLKVDFDLVVFWIIGSLTTLCLAPPPAGSGKIRSPLPPPPNDPAAARMTSTSQGVGQRAPTENTRQTDPLTNFSQLERNLPASGSGSRKTTASGWAAF